MLPNFVFAPQVGGRQPGSHTPTTWSSHRIQPEWDPVRRSFGSSLCCCRLRCQQFLTGMVLTQLSGEAEQRYRPRPRDPGMPGAWLPHRYSRRPGNKDDDFRAAFNDGDEVVASTGSRCNHSPVASPGPPLRKTLQVLRVKYNLNITATGQRADWDVVSSAATIPAERQKRCSTAVRCYYNNQARLRHCRDGSTLDAPRSSPTQESY